MTLSIFNFFIKLLDAGWSVLSALLSFGWKLITTSLDLGMRLVRGVLDLLFTPIYQLIGGVWDLSLMGLLRGGLSLLLLACLAFGIIALCKNLGRSRPFHSALLALPSWLPGKRN